MLDKQKKFVVALLIVCVVGAFPLSSLAQFMNVPVADPNAGFLTDTLSGDISTSTVVAAIKAATIANKACETAETVYFKTDKAVSFGFGGLSLISGGANVAAQLQAKITAIEGFKVCRQAILVTLDAIVTPSVFTASQKETLYNAVSTVLATLKAREEPLVNQLRVVQQGFWKTLVFNILIKTTKSVAINMANKLVNSYKIKDFAKYADAVATQVYDSQFILNNFSGNKADQMLVRSILNNPAVQSQIPPAIFMRADQALGFNPKTISYSDPNFYSKMASVGGGYANPYFQNVVLTSQAEQIRSRSVATAQAEIAQSTGLKTPRNCLGTMAQQNSIDLSYKALNDKLQDRQNLLNDLLNAQNLGRSVKQSDIDRARADYDSVLRELQALPNSVQSPIVKICEGIVSPPSLINKGIDEAFKSIGQNMGTYNENNLPFFINFITDVATQISNNLIFGGGIGGSHILDENAGNLARAGALGLGALTANNQVKQDKNFIFKSTQTDDGSDPTSATFELSWDASGVANAQQIAITGPNLPAAYNGIMAPDISSSVNVTVAVPGTYTYTITVYGKSKADVLGSITLTIAPSAVEGAFTDKPSISIRGPGVSPRGN